MREFNGVIDVNAILEESGFGNVGEKSKKRLFDAVQKAIDVFKADLETQKADLEKEIRSFDSVKANVYAADTALRNALSIISAAKASMNPMNIPEGPSDALVCVHCGSKKDVWGRTVIYPGGDFKILNLCAPCNKKMREPAESVAAPAAPRMRVRCIECELNSDGVLDLDQIYTVVKEEDGCYALKEVDGWYSKSRFKDVSCDENTEDSI